LLIQKEGRFSGQLGSLMMLVWEVMYVEVKVPVLPCASHIHTYDAEQRDLQYLIEQKSRDRYPQNVTIESLKPSTESIQALILLQKLENLQNMIAKNQKDDKCDIIARSTKARQLDQKCFHFPIIR